MFMREAAVQKTERFMMSRREGACLLYFPKGASRLENLGEVVSYPKKCIFVEGGNYTRYCYVVKRGRVISCETYPNGEERIYHFYENHALFLESELLFHKMTPVSYRAESDVELIRIDKNTLLKEMKTDSHLALEILESTYTKYYASMDQVRHMNNYNISWKLCDLILSFVEKYGVVYENKICIQEKFSQQFISNMLGVNRITVVRLMKKMKDMGLIEQKNGYMWVLSLKGLQEYQKSMEKCE